MKVNAIGLLAVVLAAWGVLVGGRSVIQAGSAPSTSSVEVEAARIQGHLARVEQELLSKDVSMLSPAQQRARREEIRRLQAYRLAGRFPHNHDFPGRRVSYFTDRHGTPCAMAYLIAASGGRAFVEQVARSANNAKVRELAASPIFGPALASWLEREGLTAEEAQRIQPAYDYNAEPEKSEISTAYGAASGGIGVLNLASVIVNGLVPKPLGRPVWVSVAGLATGSAGVALGMTNVDQRRPVKTLGLANIFVGGASILASVWSLLHSREPKLAAISTSTARLAVTPMAGVDRAMCPVIGFRAAF